MTVEGAVGGGGGHVVISPALVGGIVVATLLLTKPPVYLYAARGSPCNEGLKVTELEEEREA